MAGSAVVGRVELRQQWFHIPLIIFSVLLSTQLVSDDTWEKNDVLSFISLFLYFFYCDAINVRFLSLQ